MHSVQVPPVQRLLTQSAELAQTLPEAQFAVQLPPQSTSVSKPFLMPSEQVGATQAPPTQAVPPQLAPHLPQWFASVWVSTHEPPHSVAPALQVQTEGEFWQV